MNTTKERMNDDSLQWGACPTGELQDLATRMRATERRQAQMLAGRMIAATAAATAAVVVTIGMMLGGGENHSIVDISCAECQTNFNAYFAHLSEGESMANPTSDQMGSHMMKCGSCRDMFEEKHPGELTRAGVISASYQGLQPAGVLGYAIAY